MQRARPLGTVPGKVPVAGRKAARPKPGNQPWCYVNRGWRWRRLLCGPVPVLPFLLGYPPNKCVTGRDGKGNRCSQGSWKGLLIWTTRVPMATRPRGLDFWSGCSPCRRTCGPGRRHATCWRIGRTRTPALRSALFWIISQRQCIIFRRHSAGAGLRGVGCCINRSGTA